MSRKIKIKYKNTEYVLEYNRSTAKMLEKAGFSLEQIQNQPVTMIPLLFQGAFLAHHRKVKAELIDEMFEHTPNKDKIIGVLSEMYADTLNTLLEEPDANDEGNAIWEES